MPAEQHITLCAVDADATLVASKIIAILQPSSVVDELVRPLLS